MRRSLRSAVVAAVAAALAALLGAGAMGSPSTMAGGGASPMDLHCCRG